MESALALKKKLIGPGKNKCKFTAEEDELLKTLVEENGEDQWEYIATLMRRRNARQCKDRWTRYLSPKINMSQWTKDEERLLVDLVEKLDYKWAAIAKHFVGRTDNQIKNKWNVLKKYMKANKQSIPQALPINESLSLQETSSFLSFFNDEYGVLFENSIFNDPNINSTF